MCKVIGASEFRVVGDVSKEETFMSVQFLRDQCLKKNNNIVQSSTEYQPRASSTNLEIRDF